MERYTDCWYLDTCEDDCNNCATYTQMKWQMVHSGLPEAKQKSIPKMHITEDNEMDEPAYQRLSDIRKNIVDFVESGSNLYLCSNTAGNGKTSWAIRMLQTYFHFTAPQNYENLKGMFVSTAKLLLELKDFNNPVSKEYRRNLETVDLVVWDDVVVSGISQYDYTQLFSIIDSRILAEKSNIFTSNVVSPTTVCDILGGRLTSRIYTASEVIELRGKDMR